MYKATKKQVTIFDKRNAFSLQQKEAVLVTFRISELRELKKFRTLETLESLPT